MFFIALTFLAAFLIEGLGTYVSVIGLSTLFGANPIIIALAVALDLGKIVVVTLLYTYWNKLGKIMKAYALAASVITMIITSAGAASFLSGEFQKAIMGTQEVSLKVDVLKTEQAKLEERKKQIDAGIAAIPDRYSANQKIRLMNQFKEEQRQVTARLMEISKQLPEMQITQIGVEAKAGPILYIAKAFNISVEEAVKWVILMIIFVFDPLAVFLIIAGNFLLHQRRMHKDTSVADADLFAEEQLNRRIKIAQDVFNEPVVRGPTPEEAVAFAPLVTALQPNREAAAEIAEAHEPDNYPDTSQTRTYTRQDLIDLGATDETLTLAGYEPRQPAETFKPVADAPPSPLYEILEPTPAAPTPSAEDLVIEGTEVQIANPADSKVLPFYIAETDTEVQASPPPNSDMLSFYATTALAGQSYPKVYEEPEAITLSSLGLVKPDPATITDVNGVVNGDDYEVGLGTGVFKTGAPKR